MDGGENDARRRAANLEERVEGEMALLCCKQNFDLERSEKDSHTGSGRREGGVDGKGEGRGAG